MKKHFILLGKAGLIYGCWLLILLFTSFIFYYEKDTNFSWMQIVLLLLFFIFLIHAALFSYWEEKSHTFKLPYFKKIKSAQNPHLIWHWSHFYLWSIKPHYQTYYFLTIQKRQS